MDITRRDILPATVMAAGLAGVKIAEAALPLRAVATADGPYVSRLVDHGACGPPAKRRRLEDHNQDRYVLEIG
jgi:hypothetical protein